MDQLLFQFDLCSQSFILFIGLFDKPIRIDQQSNSLIQRLPFRFQDFFNRIFFICFGNLFQSVGQNDVLFDSFQRDFMGFGIDQRKYKGFNLLKLAIFNVHG